MGVRLMDSVRGRRDFTCLDYLEPIWYTGRSDLDEPEREQ